MLVLNGINNLAKQNRRKRSEIRKPRASEKWPARERASAHGEASPRQLSEFSQIVLQCGQF